MPLEFDKLGICFQYPDNWSLTEEDALAGCQSVTVYSPGGGFWSVAIHPPATDPGELASAALEAMEEEYEGLESEEVRETVVGREMVGHDLNFHCLDLTNTACVRSVSTGRATLTIFCQAEDREMERIQPVFQAMTISLMQNIE